MRRCLLFPVLVLLACLCLFLCLPASAGSVFYHDGITVDRGVDPAVYADGIVDFGDDFRRWCDDTGAAIQRVPAEYDGATLYELPTYLLEGEYAAVTFASPRDCGGSETLQVICNIAAEVGSTGLYYLNLTLYAGEDTLVSEVALPANQWCAVDLDIGSWPYRDAVTRIELRLIREGGSGTARLQFTHLRIDEPMDEGLRQRFLTDSFTARGGTIFMSSGVEKAYLVATDNSPALTATVLVPSSQTETNALRLVFDNETACKSVTLQYSTSPDGANARSQTLEVGTGRQTCLFEVSNAAEVRYIRLIFTGAKEGLITLRALNAVSIYETGITALGTVAECGISEDGRQISVKGTVAHDIMIANRDNRLALFRLDAWETVEDVLTDGRAPDAIADISIRYEFKLSLAQGDYAALGASYLVALQIGAEDQGDYTYIPIAAPRSLLIPAEVTETTTTTGAIKGVQTSLVSTAGQAGVSIYLVDLYLDRLCDGSAGGYLYSSGSSNCYFNRTVLAQLDQEIKVRSATGAQVYLRFLISSDGTAVNYALPPEESEAGAVRGILLGSDSARDTVAAITEFVASRYAGGDYGAIVGIVVGRQVDDAAAYNDIGVYSLSDYVDHYADLLTLVANCARQQNPALQVVIPISERRSAECITADLLENSYDSELFLRSLFKRIDEFAGPAVSLMLESEHNPFSLDAGVMAQPEEGSEEEADADPVEPDYYNADNLGDFSDLLSGLSGVYASMPSTFLYFWTPADNTGDALSAAYAYLYYRLRFSTHAEAFIVSFAEAEAAGDNSGLLKIRHLMKYIDTSRSLEVSEPSLAVFGVDSWRDLIIDFDTNRLAIRRYHEGELTTTAPEAMGRYSYWNFAEAHSTRGWYAGAHTGSLAVRGSGTNRALVAALECAGIEAGEYSELICRFTPGEPLGSLNRIAFDLMIEGDGVWEVCIYTGSQSVRLEQKQVITAGERVTLYLSPGLLGEATAGYLKLCAKPVSGSGEGKLCLYSVTGESDTLDDAGLAEHLRQIRRIESTAAETSAPTVSLAWVFVICAIVIFSLTIAVLLGRHQDEAK